MNVATSTTLNWNILKSFSNDGKDCFHFADVIERLAAINQPAFDNLCKSSFDFAHTFSANTADLSANKVMFGIQ